MEESEGIHLVLDFYCAQPLYLDLAEHKPRIVRLFLGHRRGRRSISTLSRVCFAFHATTTTRRVSSARLQIDFIYCASRIFQRVRSVARLELIHSACVESLRPRVNFTRPNISPRPPVKLRPFLNETRAGSYPRYISPDRFETATARMCVCA